MPSKPGQRKRRPLEWGDEQKHALADVFEGRKSRAKIGEDWGIPASTLEDWIAHPDFQAKLKAMREQLLQTFDELGVAYVRKEQRIMALAQMAESARQEYEQRPWLKELRPVLVKRATPPDEEGKTHMQSVEDYIITEHFNADAYAAWRQTMTDIAAETGDRKNVAEVALTVLPKVYQGTDPDEDGTQA